MSQVSGKSEAGFPAGRGPGQGNTALEGIRLQEWQDSGKTRLLCFSRLPSKTMTVEAAKNRLCDAECFQ